MNGAITEPCVNTIRVPNKTMVIISGANQYFFLTLRKSQISTNKSKSASTIKKFLSNQPYILSCILYKTFCLLLFFSFLEDHNQKFALQEK